MSYNKNRISDLVDGGLKQQEESIKIDYAVYGIIIDREPLIRYENLEEAKEDYLENGHAMIVCEVSELRNGKRVITQERVIKAPQIWLPADRFIPEFNGYYLCYYHKIEKCGSEKWMQDFRYFVDTKWSYILDTETVTHWMIVEDPILSIEFKKALEKKIKTDKGSTNDEFST